jgi:hypothetical protein
MSDAEDPGGVRKILKIGHSPIRRLVPLVPGSIRSRLDKITRPRHATAPPEPPPEPE